MRTAVREIPSDLIPKSSFRLSTKNAWAKYVRNRWPQNTLSAIQCEWDLMEGEARGVLYASASQRTIDKILDTDPDGFGLGLTILELRLGMTVAAYFAADAERARHDREQAEARIRHAERLEAAAEARRAERGGAYG